MKTKAPSAAFQHLVTKLSCDNLVALKSLLECLPLAYIRLYDCAAQVPPDLSKTQVYVVVLLER